MTNTTWYPDTQIQLDWQGSSGGASTPTAGVPWLDGWKFRRKITIQSSTTTLNNYPVWISTSSFGNSWSDIISKSKPDMGDFRFTHSSGEILNYWIDFTTSGFWVNVSTLNQGQTNIWMYYGNSSTASTKSLAGVWGTNLKFYYTLNESGGTTVYDEVTNSSGSLKNGIVRTAGKNGGSLQFDGTDDYIQVFNAPQSISNTFTMELFVIPQKIIDIFAESNSGTPNGTSYNKSLAICEQHGGDTAAGAGITIGTNGLMVIEHGSSYYPNPLSWSGTIDSSTFSHITIIYSNRVPSFYLNGTFIRTGMISGRSTVYPGIRGAIIGSGNYPGYFKGTIDEIRIYDKALSIDEIKTHADVGKVTILYTSPEEGVFFSSGNYKSNVLDCGSKIVVSSVSWNPTSQPAGTLITVGIRVSSFPFSVNSSTPPFIAVSNGQSLNWAGRYIQYISTFTTNHSTSTSRLEDISIVYHVKPFMEKSITRTGLNSFGFGGGESWQWQIPVKSGLPLTITCYIQYNTEYGGSATKPKLTLYGKGISPTSVSATAAAENAWELLTINAGTPSQDAMLKLKAEGFSTNPGARFYIDDIKVNQ